MEISIKKLLLQKFHYSNSELLQNIYNKLSNNKLSKGILVKYSYKLNFEYQFGGKKYNMELDDNKVYEYHIDEVTPLDNNQKMINFLNISEMQEDCACIIYDTKSSNTNVMWIEGILNNEDCIICSDKKHKYKVGDILMQIIIELAKSSSKFTHIKTIELSDTSIKKCYCIGLELKYLRTITHGIPYYAKYGFRPIHEYDYDVYKYNKQLYKKNILLNNDDIIELIKKSKISENEYKIYTKYFKNYIYETKLINPKILLIDMLNLIKSISDNEKNKYICLFINSIYKHIYRLIGYKEYNDKLWRLHIRE
jgi:hypothetical protein